MTKTMHEAVHGKCWRCGRAVGLRYLLDTGTGIIYCETCNKSGLVRGGIHGCTEWVNNEKLLAFFY